MSRVRHLVVTLLVTCLALVLVACGGDGGSPQPDAVDWRNVDLDIPDGWYVYERSEMHLSISNADLRPDREEGEELVAPDEGVVAMAFTYEPDSSPDDWRRFVEQQDATLEADNRLTLGGDVPATQLVFSYTSSSGTPIREMVVLVPSRAVVVLSQPVPRQGEEDAPEVFLEHIDTFLEVLQTADFGAPVLD